MSNSICLVGPPFSLTGETLFLEQVPSFEVQFDSSSDQDAVIAYEWYADGLLMLNHNQSALNWQCTEGFHTIAIRLLTGEGWSGLKSLGFRYYTYPNSVRITGPSILNEGSEAAYLVTHTFSDAYLLDLTNGYTFTANEGAFQGNIYTAPVNTGNNDSRQITISATRSNAATATYQVSLKDSSQVTFTSFSISGPTMLEEGASATFSVLALYSNGSVIDMSNQFVFFSEAGTFNGRVLTAATNVLGNDDREVLVTATRGSEVLETIILITNTSIVGPHLGILVVDLYDNEGLNAIALLEDYELEMFLTAYTGANIALYQSEPEDAFILASDFIPQSVLNWRFEFNIKKLVAEYPYSTEFRFDIKGRGLTAGTISGAYSSKSLAATMVMAGSTGSFIPTVEGGSAIGPAQAFSLPLAAGANGSYAPEDLPLIARFVYNVGSRELTLTEID